MFYKHAFLVSWCVSSHPVSISGMPSPPTGARYPDTPPTMESVNFVTNTAERKGNFD